jgi:hypothetical protein
MQSTQQITITKDAPMKELYYICRMDSDGNWQGIRSCQGEDYADKLCDYYCEIYPMAYIDVLTHDEFKHMAKWPEMAI